MDVVFIRRVIYDDEILVNLSSPISHKIENIHVAVNLFISIIIFVS